MDFVVCRAVHSKKASPELTLPRGKSCACHPFVHGAQRCDLFEYDYYVLQLSGYQWDSVAARWQKTASTGQVPRFMVWHESTTFPAVFLCRRDDGDSFMHFQSIINTKPWHCPVPPLVVPRASSFLHANGSRFTSACEPVRCFACPWFMNPHIFLKHFIIKFQCMHDLC